MTLRLLRTAPVALIIVIAGLTTAAEAAPFLDFDQGVVEGTLSYDGTTITGTDIRFDFAVATGTAADGVYGCEACYLTFTTGPVTEGGGGTARTYAWSSGSFTLTGAIPFLGGGIGPTTLISGTFESGSGTLNRVGGEWELNLSGFGFDDKDEELLAALGIVSPTFVFNQSEISSGDITFTGDDTWDALVSEADLTNREAVPVPATSLLMLLGLGALAARRRQV